MVRSRGWVSVASGAESSDCWFSSSEVSVWEEEEEEEDGFR